MFSLKFAKTLLGVIVRLGPVVSIVTFTNEVALQPLMVSLTVNV